ncbi:MAG: class I SAM-dependent methyltransferase [Gammaproteobacteria bacterium]
MKKAVYRTFRKLKSMLYGNPNRPIVNKTDFQTAYPALVKRLKYHCGTEEAMKQAVGGEFEAMGQMQLETLKYYGLKEDFYLIDVGCGSGRLANPLAHYLTGRYTGIDVVPDLVAYARQTVSRADWRFEVAQGLSIPEEDGVADMICFFSVFTHLLHEQSYVYLQEAKRVLKPGGKIIFSFLDFTVPFHWKIFEANIRDLNDNAHPLNMFMPRGAIHVWAKHLKLQVEDIKDGHKPYVPLSKPIVYENGKVVDKLGNIGQSVCVLRKSR